MENLNNKNIICIDGVVGVGKTTLCKYLCNEIENLTFFAEPVINNPILSDFYKDQNRWAFALQIFFLNRRFEMMQEAMDLNNCVMDRSIYGDVIFAKMLYNDGKMSENEYNTYIELFENMTKFITPPKLMVYLKTNVEDAVRKIQKRNRSYEQDVPLDYWISLNKYYEEYFKYYKDANISKLLVIDVTNKDFIDDVEFRNYILKQIKDNL